MQASARCTASSTCPPDHLQVHTAEAGANTCWHSATAGLLDWCQWTAASECSATASAPTATTRRVRTQHIQVMSLPLLMKRHSSLPWPLQCWQTGTDHPPTRNAARVMTICSRFVMPSSSCTPAQPHDSAQAARRQEAVSDGAPWHSELPLKKTHMMVPMARALAKLHPTSVASRKWMKI